MEKFSKKIKLNSKLSTQTINQLTVYHFNLTEYLKNLPILYEGKRKQIEKELIKVNDYINAFTEKPNEDNIS